MLIDKIECVKILKIVLIEYLFSQSYTTVSNTDSSCFDLSYAFPGHNDGVEWGLTVHILTKESKAPTQSLSLNLIVGSIS